MTIEHEQVKINEKKIASKEEYERKLYKNYKHISTSLLQC